MKIIKGKTYLHHTLGLVQIDSIESDGQHHVTVLTDNIKKNSQNEWQDDWGQHYPCEKGDSWFVKENTLTQLTKPDPKDKNRTPVQIRCKDLWNKSNYIKNNPKQAYT